MRPSEDRLGVGMYRMSKHANRRLQQRGMTPRQIELVMAYGEPFDDGYVMTQKAADRRIAELKREMGFIERAVNISVIDLSGTIVTAYRASDCTRRRKLKY